MSMMFKALLSIRKLCIGCEEQSGKVPKSMKDTQKRNSLTEEYINSCTLKNSNALTG
jgi:hypothetical protein